MNPQVREIGIKVFVAHLICPKNQSRFYTDFRFGSRQNRIFRYLNSLTSLCAPTSEDCCHALAYPLRKDGHVQKCAVRKAVEEPILFDGNMECRQYTA